MNLRELLIDFSAVPDEELKARGLAAYRLHYLDRGKFGIINSHDGAEVIFHENRYDHAFFDKPDKWSLTKNTDLPDESRLERMRWIGPLIRGEVPGSECWEVPSPTGRRRPPNRIYIHWAESYVVWLEPRENDGWKFSSAYVVSSGDIRKYTRGGRKVGAENKMPRDQEGSRGQKPNPPP